ncbi:MAG TPA: hypothetical protein VGC62_08020 [Pseudomonas sp.]|uniref:hypothetical protein n=1 Tax=Pseudomonas sp. TaxID=306 RepID=UPI002ED7D839
MTSMEENTTSSTSDLAPSVDEAPVTDEASGVDEAGSGARSLAGYDYQTDVSIWLALDVMLSSGFTTMIELEPGSEEDIEAQLADVDGPDGVPTLARVGDYTLVVQAKLRGGDAWTVKGIERLLEHGSSSRLSAATRLANPKIRYLLVTSAGLNGQTRGLEVKHAGTWPKKEKMPASMVRQLPEHSAGRVAVIGNLDEQRLTQEIERLLVVRFGVPNSRWLDCLKALRSEANLRIRRAGEGLWRREELAHVIKKHDGYLAGSPKLDSYVLPKNWNAIRDAVATPRYGAIIVGQSGTGKTLATEKLYEDLRREIPGLARVRIRKGPHEFWDDQTTPPVLYDIEDPWGRYNFDASNRPWNDELSRVLSSARPDRLIIATSRRDVAIASGGLKSVEPWVVRLEAEHYGKAERSQLYRARVESLPRNVQLPAIDAEGRVLESLATPLEIEKFFDALRIAVPPNSYSWHSFISAAIAQAHEQSIESTVVQQIEERKEVSAAAIIWGFLKATDQLSLQELRELDLDLASSSPALARGVTPLVDFFVAARNLRSSSGQVRYYHPRVEAGIEQALKRDSVPARLALRSLFDLLSDLGALGEEQGCEFAARIMMACHAIPELKLKPSPKAAKKIDAWISSRLADHSCRLSEYLAIAAAAGSPTSNVAEFARYLLNRPESELRGFDIWEAPDHPETWYAQLKKDPTVSALVTRFIKELLPTDNSYYHISLVDDLDRLATNLTGAYLSAAAKMVDHGVCSSCDVVAAGALRDLEGFETIVDAGVQVLIPTEAQQQEAYANRLAIINEVYNSDYADYLSESEDGYTAWEFLKRYADCVRTQNGWQFLARHRHLEALLPHWLTSLSHDAKSNPPSDDEISGAFSGAWDTESEATVWDVLHIHWSDEYLGKLTRRILKGSGSKTVRHAALGCLIKHIPDALSEITDLLRRDERHERIVELMIDLAAIRDEEVGGQALDDACKTLDDRDPVYAELREAAGHGTNGATAPLGQSAVKFINVSSLTSVSVRTFRIRHYRDLRDSVRPDIEWVLGQWDDSDLCVEAIDAAIELGMTEVVDAAIDHRFAHVVARALKAIVERAGAPLPESILEFANDKRSPVLKALASSLVTHSHISHLNALFRLVENQWSSSSQRYGKDDTFPIARMAVDALENIEPLGTEDVGKLLMVALETSDSTVSQGLLRIIGEKGGKEFQNRIFELAVNPGRSSVRRSCAFALLVNWEVLDTAVVDAVTLHVIQTAPAAVAAFFTTLAALRKAEDERLALARGLATNPKRRALLLLMLWPYLEINDEAVVTIASLLPENHASISWVRQGPVAKADDDLIADLGDARICREVLNLLNHGLVA